MKNGTLTTGPATFTARPAYVERGFTEDGQKAVMVEQIPAMMTEIKAIVGLAEDGFIQISERLVPVMRPAEKHIDALGGSDSYGIPLVDELANVLMRLRAVHHAQMDLLERIAL